MVSPSRTMILKRLPCVAIAKWVC